MSAKLTPDTLKAARLVNEFVVAGFTLGLADFLQTFPAEVGLIWPARMNAGKALFLVVRYTTIVLAILMFLSGFSLTLSDNGCKKIFFATGTLKLFLPLLGEVIVYIRVWAFSGCSRKVLYCLVVQYIAMFSSASYLLAKFNVSAKVFSVKPLAGLSCIFSWGDSASVIIIYCMFLASGVALMAFMIIVGVYRYSGSLEAGQRNGLFLQFYRDGFIYFLMLAVLSSANIGCIMTARAGALIELQPYIHGIVTTRMILHLHQYSEQTEEISLQLQPIHADSNNDHEGRLVAKPMGILKAMIPRLGTARSRDNIQTRTATMRFASLYLSTSSNPLP